MFGQTTGHRKESAVMIIPAKSQKRQNRTVVLHLGNTLTEYKAWLATEEHKDELLRRVEIADDLNWGHLADGHYPGCQRCLRFTHHGSYSRWLKGFNSQCEQAPIRRIRCQDCGAVFSILPSFVVRYKRWHTDAIEKLMVLLFIVEDSYRMAGVSQAFGIDAEQSGTWAALEHTTGEAISPMALWRLVQWFGQLSPAQLNLALGVEPPSHVIEDEKHLRQSGEKAYVPMIYAPKEALIWWIDYIDSVSEAALTASLERFKAISERLGQITGATVDGWDPAQNALRQAFPGVTLAECHLHAMLKFAEHLATYKRQRKTAGKPVLEAEETQIRDAFLRVLQAATEQEYQRALDELPQAFDSDPLASRKQSLTAKQTLFQAWITDGKLALVSTALDQCMKFLNRKQDNMQTLRNDHSGLATMNAWAITRNCWRFLKGALRAGLSPLELAGADFQGIPWMQLVNLVLSGWQTLHLSARLQPTST
jgi:hypothetical protein